jgi:hypothetical protein
MAALFRCYFRHDATFYANSVKYGDTKGWDYSSAKRTGTRFKARKDRSSVIIVDYDVRALMVTFFTQQLDVLTACVSRG